MRQLLLLFLLLFPLAGYSQPDSVRVVILHGSRPKKQFKKEEYKMLGGMLGGHVVLQVDSLVYGYNFHSRHVHPFARQRRSKMAGIMEKDEAAETLRRWKGQAVTIITVPVTPQQKARVFHIADSLHRAPAFDYAFFGMRCAATAHYLLGETGAVKKTKHFGSIVKAFHPKQLRRKLVRIAERKKYRIETQPGSPRRKWEGQ